MHRGDRASEDMVASLVDSKSFDGYEVKIVFHDAERFPIARKVFANGAGAVRMVGERKACRTFPNIGLHARNPV